jgi:hypothetical protein
MRVATKAAMTVPTEHAEQVSLVRWFAMQYPKLGPRLVAIPNGGARNVIVATKLKAEGVRAGFPDLMLLTPRMGFAGLIIELKRIKGGRMQPEQVEWQTWLNEQGFMAVTCNGFEAARDTIKSYLGEAA